VSPADLDNRESIIANDWHAFSRLGQLSDHWSRPGWHDGAQAFYWMIVPPAVGALRELVGNVQDAIRPLGGFDQVPVDGLHLTVHRIGSIAKFDDGSIQAIAESASLSLSTAKPFDLQVGPLAGSAGALRFSVSPWTEITSVYHQVASLGTSGARTGAKGIRPHLSIAYNNRVRRAAPVISAVQQLRSLNPVSTTIGDVHLVALRREGHLYKWETRHVVPLGDAPRG
jgi:2'-5' RNA ligase